MQTSQTSHQNTTTMRLPLNVLASVRYARNTGEYTIVLCARKGGIQLMEHDLRGPDSQQRRYLFRLCCQMIHVLDIPRIFFTHTHHVVWESLPRQKHLQYVAAVCFYRRYPIVLVQSLTSTLNMKASQAERHGSFFSRWLHGLCEVLGQVQYTST